jgi:hypothetical protein
LAKLSLILSRFWPLVKNWTFVDSAASGNLGSRPTFAAAETEFDDQMNTDKRGEGISCSFRQYNLIQIARPNTPL